jgi:hypothetical protein
MDVSRLRPAAIPLVVTGGGPFCLLLEDEFPIIIHEVARVPERELLGQ